MRTKYYKDYAKAKNAEKELTRQLELGRTELEYLNSVLDELDRAETDGELEEIKQELAAGGYLRPEAGRRRMKQAPSRPMRFVSTDGYPIYVGRNNRQNDELTLKLAQKTTCGSTCRSCTAVTSSFPGPGSSRRMPPSLRPPSWQPGSPRADRGKTSPWT